MLVVARRGRRRPRRRGEADQRRRAFRSARDNLPRAGRGRILSSPTSIGLRAETREGAPLGTIVGGAQFRRRRHSGDRARRRARRCCSPSPRRCSRVDLAGGRVVDRAAGRDRRRASERPADDDACGARRVFTLFPGHVSRPARPVAGRRRAARGVWSLEARNIRDHGLGRHRAVDDTPAGGGPGMVMRADVLAASLDAALDAGRSAPAPADEPARRASDASERARLGGGAGRVIVCGALRGRRRAGDRGARARGSLDRRLHPLGRRDRRDGADRRLRAAAAGRHGQSRIRRARKASKSGLLEYPHYTRPREWEGRAIPDVLLSGDHAEIARWRREAGAERITHARRPDLLEKRMRRDRALPKAQQI